MIRRNHNREFDRNDRNTRRGDKFDHSHSYTSNPERREYRNMNRSLDYYPRNNYRNSNRRFEDNGRIDFRSRGPSYGPSRRIGYNNYDNRFTRPRRIERIPTKEELDEELKKYMKGELVRN
ncbi:hypothetical protein SLOPH_977 [Spraguea lophii 42_110]|uniref:Uncharacterized protein n=1 Tax=Spraguea lophii (strain 42_110) TaxID=1358809 RepID=S7XIP6_SPRLO|nr:hypothetical protein SLOPH_977 [Spraguea lophii 42_110]